MFLHPPGDAVRPVHVCDRLHFLIGADRSGTPSADPPPDRLVSRCWTLLPGCRPDVAGGLFHLAALSLLQHPHQRPLPEHQPARQPLQVSTRHFHFHLFYSATFPSFYLAAVLSLTP